MAWIDQKVVAKEHLVAAAAAIAGATSASPEVVTALEELHAATVALAKMAGVLMTD
jgi:hypothetical protein